MRYNSSNVQFMLERPNTAITSPYIPFETQEYKGGPGIAISATRGGMCGGGKFGKDTMSSTMPGKLDFTTKKGSKVFHEKGKYVKKSRKPYMKGGRVGPASAGNCRPFSLFKNTDGKLWCSYMEGTGTAYENYVASIVPQFRRG